MKNCLKVGLAALSLGCYSLLMTASPVFAEGNVESKTLTWDGKATAAELEQFNKANAFYLSTVDVAESKVVVERKTITAANVIRRDGKVVRYQVLKVLTESTGVSLPIDVPMMRLERKVPLAELQVGDLVTLLGKKATWNPTNSLMLRMEGKEPVPLTKEQFEHFEIYSGRPDIKADNLTVLSVNPLKLKDGDPELNGYLAKGNAWEFDRFTQINLTDVAEAVRFSSAFLLLRQNIVVKTRKSSKGELEVEGITIYDLKPTKM